MILSLGSLTVRYSNLSGLLKAPPKPLAASATLPLRNTEVQNRRCNVTFCATFSLFCLSGSGAVMFEVPLCEAPSLRYHTPVTALVCITTHARNTICITSPREPSIKRYKSHVIQSTGLQLVVS